MTFRKNAPLNKKAKSAKQTPCIAVFRPCECFFSDSSCFPHPSGRILVQFRQIWADFGPCFCFWVSLSNFSTGAPIRFIGGYRGEVTLGWRTCMLRYLQQTKRKVRKTHLACHFLALWVPSCPIPHAFLTLPAEVSSNVAAVGQVLGHFLSFGCFCARFDG